MKQAVNCISIDIGTTNLKMTLFREKEIIESKDWRYEKIQMDQVRYVLDSLEILHLVEEGLRFFTEKYALKELDMVLTSAMHSVQLLVSDFNPKGPLYTWADLTGSHLADKRQADLLTQYERTGTPIHSMNPYFKLKTILADVRDIKVGSIKDFLVWHLTGKWILDESCASSSGIFHTQAGEWDKAILEDLGLSLSQLPQVLPGKTKLELSNYWKANLNLNAANLYLGYSDGVSSNGAFLDLEGAAVLSIGTSHAVRVLSNQFLTNREQMNFAYKVDQNRYIVGFPSNNGGNILEWINETMQTSFSEMEAIVQSEKSCSAIFLPYLNGERAPIWDANAQASLLGMTRNMTREKMIFAMIAGVFLNMRVNVEALQTLQPFDKLALTGGLIRSGPLCQFLANVLGMPLYVPKQANVETFGTLNLLSEDASHITYDQIEPEGPSYDALYADFKKALNRY